MDKPNVINISLNNPLMLISANKSPLNSVQGVIVGTNTDLFIEIALKATPLILDLISCQPTLLIFLAS